MGKHLNPSDRFISMIFSGVQDDLAAHGAEIQTFTKKLSELDARVSEVLGRLTTTSDTESSSEGVLSATKVIR